MLPFALLIDVVRLGSHTKEASANVERRDQCGRIDIEAVELQAAQVVAESRKGILDLLIHVGIGPGFRPLPAHLRGLAQPLDSAAEISAVWQTRQLLE